MSADLERRIADALKADDVKSDDLAALIEEVETAIVAADATATKAREQALDPIVSPDSTRARAAMKAAAFTRDRLRTVLPRLQQRFSEVQAHEAYAHWVVDYEQVKAKHDALVQELRETYPAVVEKLVDLLLRIETCDREVRLVNSAKPPEANGDGRWLLETELTARGIQRFGLHDLQIMRDLRLPKFEPGDQFAWPKQQLSPICPNIVCLLLP
jgi:hypothetical protein